MGVNNYRLIIVFIFQHRPNLHNIIMLHCIFDMTAYRIAIPRYISR